MQPLPPSVTLVRDQRHTDARGWFTEVYSEQRFAQLGITARFVQDNHSLSRPAFTLRGLHFQTPPFAQAKLIRCVRGRIFDVAVDLRRASPTFGRWIGMDLSADSGDQLYIPDGFAHGFMTLEDDCEVVYKVSAPYAPEHDGGIAWDSVGINWPIPAGVTPEMSAKDQVQPALAHFGISFPYNGRPLEPLA